MSSSHKMIKQFILLLICCVIFVCMGFHQDDYHIIHDKVVIEDYNHSAMRHPYINVEKFNSTNPKGTIRGNAFFTNGVKRNILVNVLVFKLVRNVYRSFPINISFDICDQMKSNSLGIQTALEHSNLRKCPCPAGEYYIKDYVLEEEKFPPHLPAGKYKLDVKVIVDDVIYLATGCWEGSIVKKHKK